MRDRLTASRTGGGWQMDSEREVALSAFIGIAPVGSRATRKELAG
jgi:hypothetical protein